MEEDAAKSNTADTSLKMDRKPKAKLKSEQPGAAGAKQKPKKKRKSPANPWKKPKDMPKRPLSAYNIFFKDERERLLTERKKLKEKEGEMGKAGKGDTKAKPKKGIGFANLAKTIAAKWNDLAPETRAPYEEHAAKEKARYDILVAKWREEQKEKAEKAKSQKKEAEEHVSPSTPSDKSSMASFSGSYPSQWFQSGSDYMSTGDRSGIPSVVDATMMTDDSSRTLASSLTDETATSPMFPLQAGAASMRAEAFPLAQQSFMSPNRYELGRAHGGAGMAQQQQPPNRQEYFAAAGVMPTMRVARMPGLEGEMERIQGQVAELRRVRESTFDEQQQQLQQQSPEVRSPTSRAGSLPGVSSLRSIQPRHTSLPSLLASQQQQFPMTLPSPQLHPRTAQPSSFAAEARSFEWNASNVPNFPQQAPGQHRMPLPPRPMDIPFHMAGEPGPQQGAASAPEDNVFDTSLRSLSENLDDDAIDFLTSMRFHQP